MGMPEMRAAEYTDGPNQDGYFTAGIDIRIVDWRGRPDWHMHAIEFHSKSKAEAEYRRNFFLTRVGY